MRKYLFIFVLPGIMAILFLANCNSPVSAPPENEEQEDNTGITTTQMLQDLDQFQTELEERFAYLKANNADYIPAINAVRDRVTAGISLDEFDIELKKVIGLFIDGHASVGVFYYPGAGLPFKMEFIGDRYIAFWPDRSDFVDPSFPFITKIDDKSIDDWCMGLTPLVAKGSPQFVKVNTLRMLKYIQYARTVLGLESSSDVTVELESEDGSGRTTLTFSVSDPPPSAGKWPNTQSHIMEGNIGYLRIRGWNSAASDEISTWMPQFQDTDGLIIDIRHNTGGTRNVLRILYPYFVTASDRPRVAGAAKYRLYREFGPDHLTGRHMYPLDWPGWTRDEQDAISEFLQTFEPEWEVPEGEFSDWHFWVLSKSSKPEAYDYTKPVVFLMDEKCFSASDVILSAAKGMTNVVLIGTPSGGGSGAFVVTTLTNSHLSLWLSSMASFQNSGRLFDSRGVEPDIFMEPVPGYFLENGPDPVLEFAIQTITIKF